VKYLQIRRKILVRFFCVKEWAVNCNSDRFCKVSMRACGLRTWQNTPSIACSLALKAVNPVGTLETCEGKAAEYPGIVLARQADYGALKSLNKSRIGQPWLCRGKWRFRFQTPEGIMSFEVMGTRVVALQTTQLPWDMPFSTQKSRHNLTWTHLEDLWAALETRKMLNLWKVLANTNAKWG
jgi:hypothetical protein